MSVGMSLLALLEERPSYGLELRNEFETRTAGVWPLNVGQVYTTLDRMERDGLVKQSEIGPDGQKIYEVTVAGRRRLHEWLSKPTDTTPPARDELVLKLVMATTAGDVSPAAVIQSERRATMELLQTYTTLKKDAGGEGDLGWLFLIDSLIFQADARIRWLDSCEGRIARADPSARRKAARTTTPRRSRKEVKA